MSMQPGSIDADGLARTSDGKLYVTAVGNAAITGGSIGTGTTGVVTLLAQSFAAVSAPSDTNEDTLATVTIPANTLGANGSFRLTAIFTYTGSVNNKVMRVRYSGGGGTALIASTRTTQTFSIITIVHGNTGATNSQAGYGSALDSGGAIGLSSNSTAVDTTASTTIVITGQKALNTETLTLVGYTVEVIH